MEPPQPADSHRYRVRRSQGIGTKFALTGGVALLLLLSSAPLAGAAGRVRPKYYIGCDPYTSSDPYVRIQTGNVGILGLTENFQTGAFKVTGKEYATSTGKANSVYDVWPWIHFGPGASAPTACIVKTVNTPTNLSFRFVRIQWTVNLTVNCSDQSTANASYAFNLTGDMADYTSNIWLVSRWNHINSLLGTYSIGCVNGGGSVYRPAPFKLNSSVVSTHGVKYTMTAYDEYMYFAQPRIFVAATSTGGGTASAEVSNVTVTLASAKCPGC